MKDRQRQGKSGRGRSIKRQRDINKKVEQQRTGVSKSEIDKEETTLRKCTNRNTEAENESWAKGRREEKGQEGGERAWV